MLGWEYAGPFDDLPAQQHDYGFPEEVAKVTQQQRAGARRGRRPRRTGSSAAART